MAHPRKTEAEFWASVRIGVPEECWPFTGRLEANGYGRLRWHSGRISSHRLAYQLTKGAIPDGLFVLHSCDYKACCNPSHLRTGTPKENARDAQLRDRLCRANRQGSHNGNSKIDEAVVQAILKDYRKERGILKTLVNKYQLSISTIAAIIKGRSWKHVPRLEIL